MLIVFWLLLLLAALSAYFGFFHKGGPEPRHQASFLICTFILLPLVMLGLWQTSTDSSALSRHIRLYPGANDTLTIPKGKDQNGVMLLQRSRDDRETIMKFFVTEAEQQGWQITAQGSQQLFLEKDSLKLRVSIAEHFSGTERTILYSLQELKLQ